MQEPHYKVRLVVRCRQPSYNGRMHGMPEGFGAVPRLNCHLSPRYHGEELCQWVRHHWRELHRTPVRTVRRYCGEAWVGVISGGPIFRSHPPSNELGCAYAVGSFPLEHTMQTPIAVVDDCKQE